MAFIFMGSILRLLVAAICLLFAASAFAASENPEDLIRQGNELRRKGDDLRAEGYFRRAFDLAKTSRAAAQLGLVEMALGMYAESEAHLTLALDEPDAWVTVNGAVLEKTRNEARKRLLRVDIAGAPAGATVAFPPRSSVRSLPPGGTLYVAPGDSTLRIEAPGFQPSIIKVSGAAGENRQVTANLVATTDNRPAAVSPAPGVVGSLSAAGTSQPAAGDVAVTPPPPATEPSPRRPGTVLRWTGIGVGAAGVAVAVTGAVVASQGSSKRQAIEAAARNGTPYDKTNGNWESLQNTGVGLLIGGAVLAAGGVTLFFVGRHMGQQDGGSSAVSLSASAGSGFGLLQCQGRF
ncbi:MAG: hypothetical protein QOI66_576 [Myxococcales bacterium]|jgi:hypothetical protein|nr:hypothetical protein [Myxococcales bacterium]